MLDKTQDSGIVVKLVEKLRQVILIYQVGTGRCRDWPRLTCLSQASQQQSIHDLITKLQQMDIYGQNCALIVSRYTYPLQTLEINPMSLHRIPVRLFLHLVGLCLLLRIADLGVLRSMKRVDGVGFNHRGRRGCLKGTRVTLLEEIDRWFKDGEQPIFWLNGLAGSGKSAIAQTVAERCFANGTLGASFFCSSGANLKGQDKFNTIFPSLAYQLAYQYPDFRSTLVPHLRFNPGIEYESLSRQVEKLIVEPLQSANIKIVIVIDALDEYKNEGPSSEILLALGSIIQSAPKTKFFITSRPEPQISHGFSCLKHSTLALHSIALDVINNDIRVFLRHGLSAELAAKKSSRFAPEELENWPTDSQLDLLCDRAAGHFAYAAATVKFLNHLFLSPKERYAIIERSPKDTIHEGRVEEVHKGLSLDSLCTSILQTSFAQNETADDATVRSVLAAAALFTPPVLPSVISKTVQLRVEEVMRILEPIYALLELSEDPDHPVRPFHQLFSDCLADPERCSDQRFLVPREAIDPSS